MGEPKLKVPPFWQLAEAKLASASVAPPYTKIGRSLFVQTCISAARAQPLSTAHNLIHNERNRRAISVTLSQDARSERRPLRPIEARDEAGRSRRFV